MFPIFIRIGPLTIHTYGVLLAAGFLAGIFLAVRQARKVGVPQEKIIDISFYIILAALIGSRIFYILLYPKPFIENPFAVFKIWEGGLVFYGGLIAALPLALWYVKRHNLGIGRTADIFAPSIALGHAIGRLGCFAAGCCYGKPSGVPWAVTFTDPDCLAVKGVPLHPSQLYEAFGEFTNFIILVLIRRYQSFSGQLFLTYISLYSLLRFIIETFRGDETRVVLFAGISVSQAISIAAGLAAAAIIVKKAGRRK